MVYSGFGSRRREAASEVTHVEGMLAPTGSGSGRKGAARRCCMLDGGAGVTRDWLQHSLWGSHSQQHLL